MAAPAFAEVDTQDCDSAGGASPCTETGNASGGAGTVTLVAQSSDDPTATDRDTLGCTIGGVAMTAVDNVIQGTNMEMDTFYSIGGSGNVVCNWTGTVTGGSIITITFTVSNQTSQPDSKAEDTTTGGTVVQQNITTLTNNVMVVDFTTSSNGSTSFTPDTPQVEPTGGDLATGQLTSATSYLLRSNPGTYQHGTTVADSSNLVYQIIGIKDAAASTTISLGTISLGTIS